MTRDSLLIRDEAGTDSKAISDVTAAAFETLEISDHTEHLIVEALRSAKALPGSRCRGCAQTTAGSSKRAARAAGTIDLRIPIIERSSCFRMYAGRAIARLATTEWNRQPTALEIRNPRSERARRRDESEIT